MRFVQDLSTETISLLTRLYKQSEHHQVRRRAHCILLSNQGYSTTILMDMFKVTRLTIYNGLNGWDERGIVGLYDRSGRGRKPTFTPDQAEQIKQWVQESPNQLKQVLAKIQKHWNITVSLKTLQRVLKTSMSWHRFRRVPWGKPDPEEYSKKVEELEKLKKMDTEGTIDLYFSDQAGFSLTSSIPYGWQFIGQTLEIPSCHSKRLNALGIMNRANDLKVYTSEQSITSDVVVHCIDTFFPKVDKRTVIVMDQAPIHTSYVVQDKLEEWQERNIEIFELPSYSPELNLIEILWRFIKYEWIDVKAYQCWNSLVNYLETVFIGFGSKYIINFA